MINFRLIRHLWLFQAIAQEKSFGRAAKRLGMSQPPLTEQIQILEQALKVKLFDRTSRGAQLTPVGAAILPAVQKLSEQLERLETSVQEAIAGQSGVLTIGAISTAMLDVLPGLLKDLKADFPKLTISIKEIDSVEAQPALEAGEIDVAFARLEGGLGPNVASLPLIGDRLAVALQRDHPLAKKTRIPLTALADEALVMFARKISPISFDALVSACNANGFSPRVLHEVRSIATQVAFVGCGQGIALVPSALKKLAPDSVVIRPLTKNIEVITTAIAWNTSRMNIWTEALVEKARNAEPRKARARAAHTA
ncbi:LysR family transcriptional regulator [Pseudomonas fluorescens]|nr:LysR family transcriptional regulator [Pseudomonas fluorescens]